MAIEDNQREKWSGTFGFFFSGVGCAVGLGNIWLFPWHLGAYGGGSFLIPFLIFTFLLVQYGLMAELAFGRATQRGTIGAFKLTFPRPRRPWALGLGGFQILAQTGITVFYYIALAWILKYTWQAVSHGFGGIEPVGYFETFRGTAAVLPWHGLMVLITALVVLLGIGGGIEKLNRWAIPVLFVLFLALVARSLTLPGALAGVSRMFVPRWEDLLRLDTWVMALGQSFFTVSLGGMLIYGSYLREETDIPRTSFWIVTANLSIALLAALAIIPAAVSFGLDPGRGSGLLFVTMPEIFARMPAGPLFGALFFIGVWLAGLSSAVNLLEIPVEGLMEITGLSRRSATLAVSLICWGMGVPLALDIDSFELWTDTVTVYLYPAGVVVIVLVSQWVYGSERLRLELNRGAARPVGSWLEPHLRYVFVAVSLLVMVLSIIYGGIG